MVNEAAQKGLIFVGCFFIIEIILSVCAINWLGSVFTGCAKEGDLAKFEGNVDAPTGLDLLTLNFITKAWDSVKGFLSMGLSLVCGMPDEVVWIVGGFNVLLLLIAWISIVFLIRG